MSSVCLISNYDTGYSWSVYIKDIFKCTPCEKHIEPDLYKISFTVSTEDLFIHKGDREHADYSFWYNIIVCGMCGYYLNDRMSIYKKYGVGTIIICEDGCIE